MKVLLTGATGFIGQHILAALIRHGIDVVTIGRRRAHAQIEFIQADLLAIDNFNEILEQAQATHLIHCAWYTQHGDYWTSILNLRWLDVSLKLIECFCLRGGQHITIAGTCAEYDWNYGYLKEDFSPLQPHTLYGSAKNSLRHLVMHLSEQYKVPCAWGRIFYSFGEGENSKRLIPSLIQVFKGEHEPFSIHTQVYRDFLHVSDVAEAFVCLLTKYAHGDFNICSAEPFRLEQLVRVLAMQLSANPELILDLSNSRAGEPHMIVGENLKLKELGWRRTLTLSQGIEEYI